MIRLYPSDLTEATSQLLDAYQQQVLDLLDYSAQVTFANRRFGQCNRPQNAAFAEVREQLKKMCCGAHRCHYCEDSVADEVEHMAPKSLYPERAFLWNNYCYACGACNGPKNGRYAIFRADTVDTLYEIPAHPAKATILVRPPAGVDVLIDPRRENPLDFMLLDLGEGSLGFRFSELDEPGTTAFKRANYTIDVLGLNKRTYLVNARRLAYSNFRARLKEYIQDRKRGLAQAKLDELRQHFQDENHQTVWQEIKRQQHLIPELSSLFANAPEALTW